MADPVVVTGVTGHTGRDETRLAAGGGRSTARAKA